MSFFLSNFWRVLILKVLSEPEVIFFTGDFFFLLLCQEKSRNKKILFSRNSTVMNRLNKNRFCFSSYYFRQISNMNIVRTLYLSVILKINKKKRFSFVKISENYCNILTAYYYICSKKFIKCFLTF